MDKKEVLTNILDRYNQSIISPVNPFTVDNPDALVFNGHSLTGLFIPWVKEQNNPDLLLRRLYISRLTLSKTVSNVLLLIGEDAIKLANNDQINAAFDAVLICEGIQDLLLFLSDNIHVRNFIDPKLKRERMKGSGEPLISSKRMALRIMNMAKIRMGWILKYKDGVLPTRCANPEMRTLSIHT